MYLVESVLKQFARIHQLRARDAFQFLREDRLEELLQDFYPECRDSSTILKEVDLTATVVETPPQSCLKEYVVARMGSNVSGNGTPRPLAEGQSDSSLGAIDRQARNHLASALRRFSKGLLTAFAFDEEIYQISQSSADDTVDFVVCSLWYFYDDCKDHLAHLSKPDWDYFERLLMLLESDAKIEQVRQRYWSIRQLVALAGLIVFAGCVQRYGVGLQILAFAACLGPLSILLSHWRKHSRQRTVEQPHLEPFSSFSELRSVRTKVSGFRKRLYFPIGDSGHNQTQRRIPNRLLLAVRWSFVSPLVLLFQTLPDQETQIRIRQGTT